MFYDISALSVQNGITFIGYNRYVGVFDNMTGVQINEFFSSHELSLDKIVLDNMVMITQDK